MGPGLGLQMGAFGSGYASAAVPTATSNPGSATVSQAAFGIGTSQTAGGPRTAGFGTMAAGAAGVAVLLFLWYSLPR
jgi:hypothetical protein